METEIYYFSGTGNSLFVARELQKRIPEAAIIPMIGLLKHTVIKTHGKTIGFVFPVHALTIPIAVKQFIRKLDLTDTEYLFAIATRQGTVFHGFKKIDHLLKKKHRRLGSQFILEMYGNDSRHGKYTVPDKSDILSLEKTVLEKLNLIKDIIATKSISRKKDTQYTIKSASNPIFGFFPERTILFLTDMAEYLGGVNYFYHDNWCTGCGTCEKVCLSTKIKMVDQKPVWQKNILCYMCFACLNYCPGKSVQIHDIPGVKSCSTENGRYPHPYATVKDIAMQKDNVSLQ